jgi:hypothetical protein
VASMSQLAEVEVVGHRALLHDGEDVLAGSRRPFRGVLSTLSEFAPFSGGEGVVMTISSRESRRW